MVSAQRNYVLISLKMLIFNSYLISVVGFPIEQTDDLDYILSDNAKNLFSMSIILLPPQSLSAAMSKPISFSFHKELFFYPIDSNGTYCNDMQLKQFKSVIDILYQAIILSISWQKIYMTVVSRKDCLKIPNLPLSP